MRRIYNPTNAYDGLKRGERYTFHDFVHRWPVQDKIYIRIYKYNYRSKYIWCSVRFYIFIWEGVHRWMSCCCRLNHIRGLNPASRYLKWRCLKIYPISRCLASYPEMFEIHAGRHCPQAKPFFNCIHIESKLDSMARSIKLDSVGTSLW